MEAATVVTMSAYPTAKILNSPPFISRISRCTHYYFPHFKKKYIQSTQKMARAKRSARKLTGTRAAMKRLKRSVRASSPALKYRSPSLWVSRKAGKTSKGHAHPCPIGYHTASAYKNYRSPARYCLRNCDLWSPPRATVRGGRCHASRSPIMSPLAKGFRRYRAVTGAAHNRASITKFVPEYRKLRRKSATALDSEGYAGVW